MEEDDRGETTQGQARAALVRGMGDVMARVRVERQMSRKDRAGQGTTALEVSWQVLRPGYEAGLIIRT